MRAGRLVQAGKAEELYREPADLFVARLFSEINEVPWRIESGALRTPVGTFSVPEMHEGERATLCLRQRSISFVAPGQGQEARVLRVKFLGDAALVEVGVQGFEAPLKALVRESEVPVQGVEVAIAVDPARVLVFPGESGENGSDARV
jgi:iron(III) transport system ATP-binding protein